MDNNNRRTFLKNISLGSLGAAFLPTLSAAEDAHAAAVDGTARYTGAGRKADHVYTDAHLSRVAYPLGGIGAGMFCLEGTGAISHMSVRNKPDVFHEPGMFAALSIKGASGIDEAIVLEGQVPHWKLFGQVNASLGGDKRPAWGLPRFEQAFFTAKFPFAEIRLEDKQIPVKASITGWSPFFPNDEDSSSLPVAGLEYHFENPTSEPLDCLFSYNSRNFMVNSRDFLMVPDTPNSIRKHPNGFLLWVDGTDKEPEKYGSFAIFTDEPNTATDHCWFRGKSFYDAVSITWKAMKAGAPRVTEPVEGDAPGGSLYVPFKLAPGAKKSIKIMMCWHVPITNIREGKLDPDHSTIADASNFHTPWYTSKFDSIQQVAQFWKNEYTALQKKTQLFTDTFYKSTLPPEVVEAVAANLTILKSPTVMRQADGKFWCWEGAGDAIGSCHGSCTHVWNYAQAVPHLFPRLERSLRETEFYVNQAEDGFQMFRANLPITRPARTFYAAADGQLGGIMKVYREWRISGDTEWLKKIYPQVQKSLDYCITTWDPKRKGIVEEPHHNTYDIEFWGPTAFATSIYLGALGAIVAMGKHLRKNVKPYEALQEKGKKYLETELYNGNYFIQKVEWEHLEAGNPLKDEKLAEKFKPEDVELVKVEGPKYQYGTGCLSDGVIGAWFSRMCGLGDPFDSSKIKQHLLSVYQHNYRTSLIDHTNPQRKTYALGEEGGLLLCSWPNDGKLTLPFIYSNEVWTGIEYQVASHLMLMGEVEKALDIVRTCRARYDGTIRNPYNEYECGHWYARALSSYGMIQGLTGVRYDAIDQTLYVDSRIGDFTSFLSTATGFGTVSLKNGKATVEVASGSIPVKSINLKNSF